MIPLGDDNSGRIRIPIVNYILIGANVAVFVFLQNLGTDNNFLLSYAMIPEEILTGIDYVAENGVGISPSPVHLTIFTSMFMHGGIAHLAGNMLYLWVFGDNLENEMGHIRYLFFYLLCGLIASLSHVMLTAIVGSQSFIPSLGASGAISGVLGGYLLLFPKNIVRVWVFAFVMRVPAFVTLGLWIALQLFSGYGSLGSEGGGVAYAAHIGGFFAGLILVKFFVMKKKVKPY
ncbi:MAG: rhomboid family intramembrane serine protease [Chitinophagaceae bacterium]|nr:MAG: rhomboid family intramembrane serine protease [Chitinophagaceae bacterium]